MATNPERSFQTRQSLIDQARRLFAENGYADTSTEAILVAARVTRGAMYHHFRDKLALLEAVCLHISEEASSAIAKALSTPPPSPRRQGAQEQLLSGSMAWMRFVLQSDVRRIMLIDAPMALGWERWRAIEAQWSTALLGHGIESAMANGEMTPGCSAELLTTMMSGALNALALRVTATEALGQSASLQPEQWQAAIHALWAPQFAPQPPPPTPPPLAASNLFKRRQSPGHA